MHGHCRTVKVKIVGSNYKLRNNHCGDKFYHPKRDRLHPTPFSKTSPASEVESFNVIKMFTLYFGQNTVGFCFNLGITCGSRWSFHHNLTKIPRKVFNKLVYTSGNQPNERKILYLKTRTTGECLDEVYESYADRIFLAAILVRSVVNSNTVTSASA